MKSWIQIRVPPNKENNEKANVSNTNWLIWVQGILVFLVVLPLSSRFLIFWNEKALKTKKKKRAVQVKYAPWQRRCLGVQATSGEPQH
jgi:hypothetical protein